MLPFKKVSRKKFGWVFWQLEGRRRASNNYSLALAQCQARMRILFAIERPDSRGTRGLSRVTSHGVRTLTNRNIQRHIQRNIRTPRNGTNSRCGIHFMEARTTIATPQTVSSMPANMLQVSASPNKAQASIAVQGGTRYIRLVTRVAAPRWINR